MGFWGHNGARRTAVTAVLAAALLLCWCGAMSLTAHPSAPASAFGSQGQFAAAYRRIVAGRTAASDLARLGFDASATGVEALSYLGVVERFTPRNSLDFDRLDPAMRSCLEARDRCKAYIFHLASSEDSKSMRLVGKTGPSLARVTLLIEDGRVAWKSMSGEGSALASIAPSRSADATR